MTESVATGFLALNTMNAIGSFLWNLYKPALQQSPISRLKFYFKVLFRKETKMRKKLSELLIFLFLVTVLTTAAADNVKVTTKSVNIIQKANEEECSAEMPTEVVCSEEVGNTKESCSESNSNEGKIFFPNKKYI